MWVNQLVLFEVDKQSTSDLDPRFLKLQLLGTDNPDRHLRL